MRSFEVQLKPERKIVGAHGIDFDKVSHKNLPFSILVLDFQVN